MPRWKLPEMVSFVIAVVSVPPPWRTTCSALVPGPAVCVIELSLIVPVVVGVPVVACVTAIARLPVPENPVPLTALLPKMLYVTVLPVQELPITTPAVLLLVSKAVTDASIFPFVPPAVACTPVPLPLASLVELTMVRPEVPLTMRRKLPPVSEFTDR
jgi:hypothetical protein